MQGGDRVAGADRRFVAVPESRAELAGVGDEPESDVQPVANVTERGGRTRLVNEGVAWDERNDGSGHGDRHRLGDSGER